MSKYFKPDTTFGAEAECAICCCMWTDPVEISKCDHIFCRDCVQGLSTCPTCCGEVEAIKRPNNAIIRMLMRVHGSCSVCGWAGTYKDYQEKHQTCQGSEATSSPPAPESETQLQQEEQTLQDYFLQEPSTMSQPAYSVLADVSSVKAPTPLAPKAPRYDAAASADRSTSTAQRRGKREWISSLDIRAADFGLRPAEFDQVVEQFYDLSTATVGGEPRLRWRDACRLLRYGNYPNHPDDVQSLFDSVRESPSSGSISLEALCLWIPLNYRSPQQWYAMPMDAYYRILQLAQLLDSDKTGLFTLDQAQMLAEDYFERDVNEPEWRVIKKYIKDKDISIRQAMMASVARSTVVAERDLKVPFHDILLSFRLYVDQRKQAERQAAKLTPKQEMLIQRIRNIVQCYEPSGLPRLEATLQNFRGEEESLLMTMVAMYGPEPPMRR